MIYLKNKKIILKILFLCYYYVVGDIMFKKNKINLLIVMVFTLGFTLSVNAANCDGVIGPELMSEINSILRIIQIATPVILLLLTSIDFAKVVFNDNKDGLDKAKNNFMKRSIAAMIVFFAPYIIRLVLNLINDASLSSAASCIK